MTTSLEFYNIVTPEVFMQRLIDGLLIVFICLIIVFVSYKIVMGLNNKEEN